MLAFSTPEVGLQVYAAMLAFDMGPCPFKANASLSELSP